ADFPGPNSNGVRTINHAYQSLQHQRALNAGLPGGRGHTSGDTVFGANTLSLRLTYLHVPLVPGLRAMLRHLGSTLPDTGFAAQAMRDAGVLPIRQTVSLAMQSSPWEQEHDSIRAPAARLPARSPAAASSTQAYASPCLGLWCDTAWPGQPGERGQSVIAAPRPA